MSPEKCASSSIKRIEEDSLKSCGCSVEEQNDVRSAKTPFRKWGLCLNRENRKEHTGKLNKAS